VQLRTEDASVDRELSVWSILIKERLLTAVLHIHQYDKRRDRSLRVRVDYLSTANPSTLDQSHVSIDLTAGFKLYSFEEIRVQL
jgi:hypothetical protein